MAREYHTLRKEGCLFGLHSRRKKERKKEVIRIIILIVNSVFRQGKEQSFNEGSSEYELNLSLSLLESKKKFQTTPSRGIFLRFSKGYCNT